MENEKDELLNELTSVNSRYIELSDKLIKYIDVLTEKQKILLRLQIDILGSYSDVLQARILEYEEEFKLTL